MTKFSVSDGELLNYFETSPDAMDQRMRRRIAAGQCDVRTALYWRLLEESSERRRLEERLRSRLRAAVG